jgi:hypothetical protein
MLRWRIAILISAAIAISYLDRQTLPVAIDVGERGIVSSPALTPRRGNSHRTILVLRDQCYRIQRSVLRRGGERFSLSPGERAGVRAGLTLTSSQETPSHKNVQESLLQSRFHQRNGGMENPAKSKRKIARQTQDCVIGEFSIHSCSGRPVDRIALGAFQTWADFAVIA